MSGFSIGHLLSHPEAIYEPLLDRGVVPDLALRAAIRYLSNIRLKENEQGSFTANHVKKMAYIEALKARTTIAEHTDEANDQHYEVSTKFMKLCMGERMKYSSCLFPKGTETLEQGEEAMLQDYCGKAKLRDGLDILDLGCGWGSLTLFLAAKYPNSKITSLSNSKTQKVYIDDKAKALGLSNVTVYTGDVNVFEFSGRKTFDRIMSIEMFEHMKNYQHLFKKVSSWLKHDGLVFIHIFCHKLQPYDFEMGDGWMTKYFFTGGTMPSSDLFLYFQDDLSIEQSWLINGKHYSRTSQLWLERLMKNKARAVEYLEETYGWAPPESDRAKQGEQGGPLKRNKDNWVKLPPNQARAEAEKWFQRWRVFYTSVEEFFKINDGEEWMVGHYLFKKR